MPNGGRLPRPVAAQAGGSEDTLDGSGGGSESSAGHPDPQPDIGGGGGEDSNHGSGGEGGSGSSHGGRHGSGSGGGDPGPHGSGSGGGGDPGPHASGSGLGGDPGPSAPPVAPPLPAPPAVPRAAPGERVLIRFGRFSISEMRASGEIIGYGANCNNHHNPDFPRRYCKSRLQFRKRNKPDLTEDQIIRGLKRWLLYGVSIDNDSHENPQKAHQEIDPYACAALPADPEEDLDADVDMLAPQRS